MNVSYTMTTMLQKIAAAGNRGVAISNTNATAEALRVRGLIAEIDQQPGDGRWDFRWIATDAGHELARKP